MCAIALMPTVSEAFHYPGEHMTDYKFSDDIVLLADNFISYESAAYFPFDLIKWCPSVVESNSDEENHGKATATAKFNMEHKHKDIRKIDKNHVSQADMESTAFRWF